MRSRILFGICCISVVLGQPSFTAHTITTSADGANDVHAVDVDGDGDIDILSASTYDDKIVWYDNTKLNVSTVSPGTFFNSTQAPIFIYEDNAGVLDIFTFYMGSDQTKDGTGDVAVITFTTTLAGQSEVQFTAESELLDPQDVPIEIKGLGTGVVNAE